MPKHMWANEIGKTGIKWSYGHISQEFLVELRGIRGIRNYREMSLNDPIIGACMFAIKNIIREARWNSNPADNSDKARRNADFLQENMFGMKHSWNMMIMDILSMLVFGWSWHEVVYTRKSDGTIRWKKIPIRIQESWERWELDDNGSILGFWQRPAPDYRSYFIPIWKSLLFRTELAGDNPEGQSVLRYSYVPYYYKKNIQEVEGVGIERDLAGLPVMEPPENFNFFGDTEEVATAHTYAKETLANVRRDEQDGLFLPPGWKFSLLSSGGARQINTTETINRYNKEIAVTVLAQFIMLGMERTGSYALAKEQIDMFYICLEGWINGIGDIFNRYAIPKLFALNNMDGPLPHITHTGIRRYSLKDLSNYVSVLSGVNAIDIDDGLKSFLKAYARLQEYREEAQ